MNICGENHPKPCQATFWKSPQVSSLKLAIFPVSNVPFQSELHLLAKSFSEPWKGLGQGWSWPKHPSLLKVVAYAIGLCLFSPSTQHLPHFCSGFEPSMTDPTSGRRLDWKHLGSPPAWIILWPCVRPHSRNAGLKPGWPWNWHFYLV